MAGSRGARAVRRTLFALALLCGVAGTRPLEPETDGVSKGAADAFTILSGAPHGSGFPSAAQLANFEERMRAWSKRQVIPVPPVPQNSISELALPRFFSGFAEVRVGKQGDSDRPAIVAHPQFGLGNRISSVVSSLALALITDRFPSQLSQLTHRQPPISRAPPLPRLPSLLPVVHAEPPEPHVGAFSSSGESTSSRSFPRPSTRAPLAPSAPPPTRSSTSLPPPPPSGIQS